MLLAFNTLLSQNLQTRYQLAIGALPVSLMFGSLWPSFLIATAVASAQGSSIEVPLRQQPYWVLWALAFLTLILALMLAGYAIGWLLNAAIARWALGWRTERIAAVFLRAEVPAHWLKPAAAAQTATARWEQQRQSGMLRFVLVRGVASWGGWMLLVMYIAPTVIQGRSFTLRSSILSIGLWALAGAVFGAMMWHLTEADYRKRRAKATTESG